MNEFEKTVMDRLWWQARSEVFEEENANLRRERDFYFNQVEENEQRHQIAYDNLARENDKLRELAYKAWKAAERLCLAFEGPCSGDCDFHGPCPMGERDGECIYGQLQRELRELGVEVE